MDSRKARFKATSLSGGKYHEKKVTEHAQKQKDDRSNSLMARRGVISASFDIALDDSSSSLTADSQERILSALQSTSTDENGIKLQAIKSLTNFCCNSEASTLAVVPLLPVLMSILAEPSTSQQEELLVVELMGCLTHESYECCMAVLRQTDIVSVMLQIVTKYTQNHHDNITTIPNTDHTLAQCLRCIGGVFRWISFDGIDELSLKDIVFKLLQVLSGPLNHASLEESLWCFVYLTARVPACSLVLVQTQWCELLRHWTETLRTSDNEHFVALCIPLSRIVANISGDSVFAVYFESHVVPIAHIISSLFWERADSDSSGRKPMVSAMWRMWCSILESYVKHHLLTATTSDTTKSLSLLQDLVRTCFNGDIAHGFVVITTATVVRHRTDTLVSKLAIQVFYLLIMSLHRLEEAMSFLTHGQDHLTVTVLLANARSFFISPLIIQQSSETASQQVIPLRVFLQNIRDKTTDVDSYYFILQLALFVIEDSKTRSPAIQIIIEMDITEEIENIQYCCAREEIADLASTVVDAVYQVMESEEY